MPTVIFVPEIACVTNSVGVAARAVSYTMVIGWSLRRSVPRNGEPLARILFAPVPLAPYVAFAVACRVKATLAACAVPDRFASTSIAMLPSWQLIHAPDTPLWMAADVGAAASIVELAYT